MLKILIIGILLGIIVAVVLNRGKMSKKVYLALNETEGNYQDISFQQVKEKLEDDNVTLIDVRNYDEVDKSGIVKNGFNIPLGELESKMNFLNKDSEYILICALGGRSKKAAAILSNNGFKKIYNSIEGMNTWPYPEMVEKNISNIKRIP